MTVAFPGQRMRERKGERIESKNHNLFTTQHQKWHPITSTVLYHLGACHKVQHMLKGWRVRHPLLWGQVPKNIVNFRSPTSVFHNSRELGNLNIQVYLGDQLAQLPQLEEERGLQVPSWKSHNQLPQRWIQLSYCCYVRLDLVSKSCGQSHSVDRLWYVPMSPVPEKLEPVCGFFSLALTNMPIPHVL